MLLSFIIYHFIFISLGWVGIGFSRNDGMPESDIIVGTNIFLQLKKKYNITKTTTKQGWINQDGKSATIIDRWATGHVMPLSDVAQGGTDDVFDFEFELEEDLVTGRTFTNLRFKRKMRMFFWGFFWVVFKVFFFFCLVTPDKKFDLQFVNGTLFHLLWAYGDDDSVNYDAGTFTQHVQRVCGIIVGW